MSELRTVRKQSSRRLYYPSDKQFVTLPDIYAWVVNGADVHVIDVKTGEDVTCDVLFQVLAAQERTATPSMSSDFLLEVIRAGAQSSGGMVATFLEQSMNLFKTFQKCLKTPGSAGQKAATRMAQRFAEANYQRWQGVQGKLYAALASAQSPRSAAGDLRPQMFAPLSSLSPTRRSKRSPRPPAARAQR
jgi:polyhydroxyalkanoate synthesis repressor PhaR